MELGSNFLCRAAIKGSVFEEFQLCLLILINIYVSIQDMFGELPFS